MSPKEAIAVLNLLAARAAKNGNYGLHADLTGAIECIDSLVEQLQQQRDAGAELVRQVMASRESLSKPPCD